jgi:hypothetical protein
VKAYIEGVRIKNDDEIIPCANEAQTKTVVKQMLAHYPELVEDDLEVTEIVFPSIRHLLMFVVASLLSRIGG